MKYQVIVVVDVQDGHRAEALAKVARLAVEDNLNLEREDIVSSYSQPE